MPEKKDHHENQPQNHEPNSGSNPARKLIGDGEPIVWPPDDPPDDPLSPAVANLVKLLIEVSQRNPDCTIQKPENILTAVDHYDWITFLVDQIKGPILKDHRKQLAAALQTVAGIVNDSILGVDDQLLQSYLAAVPDSGFYIDNLSSWAKYAEKRSAEIRIIEAFNQITGKTFKNVIAGLKYNLPARHDPDYLYPLCSQNDWMLKERKITENFSLRNRRIADWVYDRAPIFPDQKELDKMQAMVKGYLFKINGNSYPVAAVKTDTEFYSDMIKFIAGKDGKQISFKHAQKIIEAMTRKHAIFIRIAGQGAGFLVVGYYIPNRANPYKRPILSQKRSAKWLRKFKIF